MKRIAEELQPAGVRCLTASRNKETPPPKKKCYFDTYPALHDAGARTAAAPTTSTEDPGGSAGAPASAHVRRTRGHENDRIREDSLRGDPAVRRGVRGFARC